MGGAEAAPRPAHLAVVPPGHGDAVGGRGQVHEVGEVDGAAGPLGLHSGLVGGVVALEADAGAHTAERGSTAASRPHPPQRPRAAQGAPLTGTEQ